MWTAAACPRVLRARASAGGLFDAAALGARVVRTGGHEHVAIAHPDGLLRIDVLAGTVGDGPASLLFELRHDGTFRHQLDALRSFEAVLAGRRMSAARNARIRRAAQALRAYDARRCGVSLRDIAMDLLDARDWPGPGECVKSQVRRLVAAGERLVATGPRSVLIG